MARNRSSFEFVQSLIWQKKIEKTEEASNFFRTSSEAYFGKKIEDSNFFGSKAYFQIEPNSLKNLP